MWLTQLLVLTLKKIRKLSIIGENKLMFNFYRYNLGALGNRTSIDRHAIVRGHLSNIYLGSNTWIQSRSVIDCNVDNAHIRIGDNSIVLENAMLLAQGGDINIGNYCSIHPFCVLYGQGGLTIGNCVRIAAHTVIVPANHIFEDHDKPIFRQGSTKKGVVIGDDVWIGTGVKILDGCHVGEGSVIGAGTVLTKSVEPYSVVVGVPGKVVRKRMKLDRETIAT